MRVALRRPHPAPVLPPLLDPAGAAVILGRLPGAPVAPLSADRRTLFGPRGVLWLEDGSLLVADSGHHRLLLWGDPNRDGQPADLWWGQEDASGQRPNRGGEVGALGLRLPVGLAAGRGRLFVADSFNHRVLVFAGIPRGPAERPVAVIGQDGFACGEPNRGGAPDATTLHWPFGVHLDQAGRLWVADAGNRRVLMWTEPPETPAQPAELVLGQADPRSRDGNAGGAVGAAGMRWPHAVWVAQERLLVADAGTSRIMIWDRIPERDGAPCDRVLGQPDPVSDGHNRGRGEPGADTLSMPYALAALLDGRILVADTANSRLLAFAPDATTGAPAVALTGQSDAGTRGDNRWRAPARDSLSWPYGLSPLGRRIAVADTGNDRVLLWELAS